MSSTPNGIRTRATAVKGRRPRPLDDGGLPVRTWVPEASYSIGPGRGAAQNTRPPGNPFALSLPAPIACLVVSTDATPLRFLIVDDTDDIRDLLARMVVRQGHLAEEAADGCLLYTSPSPRD